MAQLHFDELGKPLFVYSLRKGRTLIGRSDRCDVALPSEHVSRVHCIVEEHPGEWRLVDRSRHGTTVNGAAVEAAVLQHDDVIEIGDYRIRFAQEAHPLQRLRTVSEPLPWAGFEELMGVGEQGVAALRAQIRFVLGTLEGQVRVLERTHTVLGGPGAHLELDGQLPARSVMLRVIRGRPMVEPGQAAVFLSGQRVREITPVEPGEEVRVGQHGFIFEEHREESAHDRAQFGEMVGASPIMRRTFGLLERMAAHDSPVLLVGESGTGKELAARALHTEGAVHDGPFVAVNCAAIAPTLVESELFGHEKGAFTGAIARKEGAFSHAHGGTLFLDEIGEMPLDLQAKLLRVLESGEVRRVGGVEPIFPVVRVVSATHRDLHQMIRDSRFREDLYWRLAVLTVRLPALRERPEDTPMLARALLARHHPDATLAPEAEAMLRAHAWPGNVRELRNVLTRAYVLGGPRLTAAQVEVQPWAFEDAAPEALPDTAGAERERIAGALAAAGGNRTQAARSLGIPRSTLLYRLRKHGLG